MSEIAIQQALFTKLSALTTPVYDYVKQDKNTAFPYITIGEATHSDWSTDSESGFECTVTIHVWSRKEGRKEVKTIQGEVYAALHRQALTVTGYALVDCNFENSDTFLDPDGITHHGTQTFRIIIDQQ
jgi:hypothetical protein